MRTVTISYKLTIERPEDPVHYDDELYPVVSDILHQLAESDLAKGNGRQNEVHIGVFTPKNHTWGSRVPVVTHFHVDVHVDEDEHDSDCATHNEPAYPNGKCDCSVNRSIPKMSTNKPKLGI